MTFITQINTPSASLIQFNENSEVEQIFGVSTKLVITGGLNIPGTTALSVADELTFGGVVTGSSPFNIYLNPSINSGILDFNSTARLDLVSGFLGIKTGTSSISSALQMGVNTATVFQGNTNISDGRLYFDATNGRMGVHTTSPNCTLQIKSNSTRFGNTKFTLNNGIGIQIENPNPSPVIHLFKSTVNNAAFDSDSFIAIEDANKSVIQIITENSSAGFMLSAVPSPLITTSNKHWFIFASYGTAPTYTPSGGGQEASEPPSVNDLYFGFMETSNTAPFETCFNSTSGIKGYLQFNHYSGEINFTGQHICNPAEGTIEQYYDKIGLIVISSGVYCETVDPNDDSGTTVSINESLPKVVLSSARNDKRVFGVISGKDALENTRLYNDGRFVTVYEKKLNDHRLIINSVGEGAIWICNINGNLENGDYITSCEIPGYGMKQDSNDLYNYTVAKITCDCDFNLNSSIYKCEEFEFGGSIYRRAFVGCTYHCG
jgi:hypothetical protein